MHQHEYIYAFKDKHAPGICMFESIYQILTFCEDAILKVYNDLHMQSFLYVSIQVCENVSMREYEYASMQECEYAFLLEG